MEILSYLAAVLASRIPVSFGGHGTCDEAAYVKGALVTRSMVICVNFKSMVVHLWTYNLRKVPLIKPPTILPSEQQSVVHINILCRCLLSNSYITYM